MGKRVPKFSQNTMKTHLWISMHTVESNFSTLVTVSKVKIHRQIKSRLLVVQRDLFETVEAIFQACFSHKTEEEN